ncbi:amino acid ABC transporter permease [Sulfitobacter sp. S190]|uniref:amino acid ABC transporter permease n=1 Tax=Sulfitobacter sp. S190 TaxID=2867022 RepID=UPI0021A27A4E|nr:amino acid ABC transporter permease [Sulfitobacter sp. S190]UWR23272.1 amino acid ABC transporter permease [Sulfitobacter sp. S190]
MRQHPDAGGDFPYWLVAVFAALVWAFWQVVTQDIYLDVLSKLSRGIWITLQVSVVGYLSACAVGLALALMQRSGNIVVRQVARGYVEIMRGIPILVLLLYVAFVLAPALVALWNWSAGYTGAEELRTRDFPFVWRATLALVLAYSSFLAEVFRAGLQSIDIGQVEAAEALGLNRWQRFRHVIWPQAVRIVMPPLGNDFVAMLKDSSLVSVVGVQDIAQIGKLTAAGNFRYFETYNVVALVYLTMTIALSLALRAFERHLKRNDR